MTFLLDNLTAIVVGTVLIGALFVLQQRGQQTAVAAVQLQQAQTQANTFTTAVERELENARSRAETERIYQVASGASRFGTDRYRFGIRQATASDGTVYTSQLVFPTHSDPDALDASPIQTVIYEVTETTGTARVDNRDRPLLEVARFEFPRGGPLRRTGVYTRIVDFDVTAFAADGTEVTAQAQMAETPVRVHVELRFAPDVVRQQTSDQARDMVTSTRLARTARVTGALAQTGDAPVDATLPGGLPPLLPGEAQQVSSITA